MSRPFMRKNWHYRSTPITDERREQLAQAEAAHAALIRRCAVAVRRVKTEAGDLSALSRDEIRQRVIDCGELQPADVAAFRTRVTDRTLRGLLDIQPGDLVYGAEGGGWHAVDDDQPSEVVL